MNLEKKNCSTKRKRKNVNEGMFSWDYAGFSACNVI
jgi:hypothetical protein